MLPPWFWLFVYYNEQRMGLEVSGGEKREGHNNVLLMAKGSQGEGYVWISGYKV